MPPALVLIDLQNDYFPGGRMELFAAEAAVSKARQALDRFRGQNLPVVHVRHFASSPGAPFLEAGTPGAQIHPLVAPLPGERVIDKRYPNAFRDTALRETLLDLAADHLFFAGMMSHMCVDATVRAAFDLGFRCTVLADACATRELRFGHSVATAPQVQAAFMAALGQVYAVTLSVKDLPARFAPTG